MNRTTRLASVLFVLLLALTPSLAHADVTLPKIFSSNMVLQRELPVPIWGMADPTEKVAVKFAGQSKHTKADSDGKWMVLLDPLATSSQERPLLVEGKNRLELSGVLVGEVWLCSGQSNMADSFNSSKNRHIEPEYFEKGLTRMRVSTRHGWTGIDERTQRTVSRVGFYFGERLYRELDVPVGLILRYNSGTPIQAWIPKDDSEVIRKRLGIPEGWNDVQDNRNPGVQYADKIDPIVPVCFRGAIWYQGERNAKAQTGFEYRQLLPFMIENWRQLFARRAGLPERKFPFYYVQVPTQDATGEWPWLRDAMRRALATTQNTGMAVFYDHGPSLHPHDKQYAGQRLALWALAKDYGRSELPYSGPLLQNVEFRGNTAQLSFDHVADGLSNPIGDDSNLDFFEIAGKDGKYVPANAMIVGDQVHVTSPQINTPKYVRYLFRKPEPDPAISLVNSAGLPASSFITDDFKPPREPITQHAPKRELTEAEWTTRKASRLAKRAEQQTPSGKPSPAKAMKAEDADGGVLTEDNGLAPEVTDLSSDDISFAQEQHLPDLKRPFLDTSPEDMADGIEVGELGLDSGNKEMILALAREIAVGQHGEVDSLLIHHDGRLIFESYYRRGRANYPHYQMSITKSYTALALGRAIQLDYLKMSDLNRPVLDFLTNIDQSRLATGCDTITLNDALNMHSGIRVAKETVEKLRKSRSTLKGQGQIQAYLENTAPITTESKQYKYQSSDPSIVMQVIETVVPGTATEFINKELLGSLGISKFGWQDDVSGLPKSAAGSSMRSRDMIKWGMLVQSGGQWDGEQLIPADFVQKATSKIHTNPQDTSYGFFWWRNNVDVDGKTYDMKSGRGAGGQFIMMIDELNLIIAITSHNKGMGKMLKTAPERIVPAIGSKGS
ncbi:Beta-lactamase [Planctomycetes bacterium CA13]|uniref:Beta-lactamase n=1 Tax=Novipirellula herctigrandis TaxID=2527986 RepID=A0A5C5Z447_9BACT|nr:Beta-lactamase [Planctomycetes bacterium CA13]